MKNSKKITAIATGIIAAAIVLFVFVIIMWQGSDNHNQTETTQDTTATQYVTAAPTQKTALPPTVPAETTVVEETTQEPTENKADSITGKYKATKAEDVNTGEEIRLKTAFGSGYNPTTDGLNLKEDGTFTLWLGVGRDDGSHSGKYTVTDSAIKAEFDNGTKQDFRIDSESGQIICQVRDCFVYFEKR